VQKIERWKDIPGWEGLYQVSDLGRVMSIPRKGAIGGLLNPYEKKDGYQIIKLCHGSVRLDFRVHRLVMLAFSGPSDLHVLHSDHDRSNNRLSNLRYGTHQDNMDDLASSGRRKSNAPKGVNHPRARLTEREVRKIRKRLAEGQTTQVDLGKKFGVSFRTINDIKCGRTWAHLMGQ
jgi:hypothetical protein